MRQNSRRGFSDEKSPEKVKSTGPVDGTAAMSEPQKADAPGRNVKVPRLDMSKVLNPPQNVANKPKVVHAKPNEQDQKEDQAKLPEMQPKSNTLSQKQQTNTQSNKVSFVENKDATPEKKPTEPLKEQQSKGTNVKGDSSTKDAASQPQKEEKKSEPPKIVEIDKKSVSEPVKKPVPIKTQTQEPSTKDDSKVPEMKKGPSFLGGDLKVSPDLFVSLKTASIESVYKLGQVLGEGNIYWSFNAEML